MSRDPGPTDCCTYGCTQGRNCPVRGTHYHAETPSADAPQDLTFTRTDGVLLGLGLFLLLLSAMSLVMALVNFFYYLEIF